MCYSTIIHFTIKLNSKLDLWYIWFRIPDFRISPGGRKHRHTQDKQTNLEAGIRGWE